MVKTLYPLLITNYHDCLLASSVMVRDILGHWVRRQQKYY